MSKNTRQNGAAQLPDAAEQMRLQVIELELKARYWKASHDIMFYAIQGDKLTAEYEALQTRQQEASDKAREEMKQNLIKAGLINEDGTPKINAEPTQDDPEMTSEDVEALKTEFKENAIV